MDGTAKEIAGSQIFQNTFFCLRDEIATGIRIHGVVELERGRARFRSAGATDHDSKRIHLSCRT